MKSNAKQVMKRLKQKFDKALLTAPKILANEGVKQFLDNFKTESFEGNKWAKRKVSYKKFTRAQKRWGTMQDRPILIGRTRMLRNATRNSIRHTSTKMIRWSNDVAYAAVHNEGTATTPKRQFMGTGRKFNRALKMKYHQILSRVK